MVALCKSRSRVDGLGFLADVGGALDSVMVAGQAAAGAHAADDHLQCLDQLMRKGEAAEACRGGLPGHASNCGPYTGHDAAAGAYNACRPIGFEMAAARMGSLPGHAAAGAYAGRDHLQCPDQIGREPV